MSRGLVTIRLTSRWPYNPLSLAIGIASGSHEFSHTITIIGDRAWEASMTHGCRAGTVNELMKGIVRYRDIQVWVPDIQAAIDFGDAQAGKGYDFIGAVGIPLTYSTNWADDGKWWCSEMSFAQVMAGGTELFDPAEMSRVRPCDFLLCTHPKSALMYA